MLASMLTRCAADGTAHPTLWGTPYPMVAAKDGHNGMDGYLHGCVSRVWHADAYRDAYHVICSVALGICIMHMP